MSDNELEEVDTGKNLGWWGREFKKTPVTPIHPVAGAGWDFLRLYGKMILAGLAVLIGLVVVFFRFPEYLIEFVVANVITYPLSIWIADKLLRHKRSYIVTTQTEGVHYATGKWIEDTDGVIRQGMVLGKVTSQHIDLVYDDMLDPDSPWAINTYGLTTVSTSGSGKILNASYQDKENGAYIGKFGLNDNITYAPLMSTFNPRLTVAQKRLTRIAKKNSIPVEDLNSAMVMIDEIKAKVDEYNRKMKEYVSDYIYFDDLIRRDKKIILGINYKSIKNYSKWVDAQNSTAAEFVPQIRQTIEVVDQAIAESDALDQLFALKSLKERAEVRTEEAYYKGKSRASMKEKVLLIQETLKRKPETIDITKFREQATGEEDKNGN